VVLQAWLFMVVLLLDSGQLAPGGKTILSAPTHL
jgi:hypothetical protein